MFLKQSHIHTILVELVSWHHYDLVYVAKRIHIPQTEILKGLKKKSIGRNHCRNILCYYLAYRESMRRETPTFH